MGGWLASANYVGYLAGRAVRDAECACARRSAIRAGLVTIGLATLAMGARRRPRLAWLVLRFLIAGVASAWVLIYVSAWCLERLASLGRLGLANTVYAGVGAGIVLAGGLCLALMHAGAGSARAWTVLGAISLVLAIVIWPAFRREASAPASPERAGTRTVVWDRESLRLVLCYGAFGFGYIIPATFLPVMAQQVIRDPAVFGLVVAGLRRGGDGIDARRRRLAEPHEHSPPVDREPSRDGARRRRFRSSGRASWPSCSPRFSSAARSWSSRWSACRRRAAWRANGATGLMAALTSAFALGQIAGPIVVSYVIAAGGGFSAALLVAGAVLLLSAYELS